MSIESAEMTKHALNTFLATSVALTNELALLCTAVGADARQVERGLRGDPRIGGQAYVRAGHAFSGGTLARDLRVLSGLARSLDIATPVLDGVWESNSRQLNWIDSALDRTLGSVQGKQISVLGLTYKPGTNTLRRSAAIDLCRRLAGHGATVLAFDPSICCLPEGISNYVDLKLSVGDAVRGSSALVIATEWPEFTRIDANDVIHLMSMPVVVDPGRFLEESFGSNPLVHYVSVGRPE
jgi:UDPglucose 6-dehydrogenase